MAKHGSAGSIAKATRRATRQLHGRREPVLSPIDEAFGIKHPAALLVLGVGAPNFHPDERRRRRSANKRQRAARRAGR